MDETHFLEEWSVHGDTYPVIPALERLKEEDELHSETLVSKLSNNNNKKKFSRNLRSVLQAIYKEELKAICYVKGNRFFHLGRIGRQLVWKFREHCFITFPSIQQAGTSSSIEFPQQYIRGFILVHHFSVLSCAFVIYIEEIRRGMRLSLWPLPNREKKWINSISQCRSLSMATSNYSAPPVLPQRITSFHQWKKKQSGWLENFFLHCLLFSAFPSFCKQRALFSQRKWEWQGPHFISLLQ